MSWDVKRARSSCAAFSRAAQALGVLVVAGCVAEVPASEPDAEVDADPTVLAQRNACASGQPEVAACDMSRLESGRTWVNIGGQSQMVPYKLVGSGNRRLVMQGDIVLRNEKDVQPRAGGGTAAVGLTELGSKWPNGRIPYVFDQGMVVGDRVERAMRVWESKTSIRFVPRTASDGNYVKFWSASGYSSRVGCTGAEQAVDIKIDPSQGAIMHELGHVIGLFHEQSRSDRDQWVKIDVENIATDKRDDFEKLAGVIGVADFGPYDFTSIMHYPWNAFSVNDALPTIEIQPRVTLPAGVTYETMGQRTAPSAGDIDAVNKMYPR